MWHELLEDVHCLSIQYPHTHNHLCIDRTSTTRDPLYTKQLMACSERHKRATLPTMLVTDHNTATLLIQQHG